MPSISAGISAQEHPNLGRWFKQMLWNSRCIRGDRAYMMNIKVEGLLYRPVSRLTLRPRSSEADPRREPTEPPRTRILCGYPGSRQQPLDNESTTDGCLPRNADHYRERGALA